MSNKSWCPEFWVGGSFLTFGKPTRRRCIYRLENRCLPGETLTNFEVQLDRSWRFFPRTSPLTPRSLLFLEPSRLDSCSPNTYLGRCNTVGPAKVFWSDIVNDSLVNPHLSWDGCLLAITFPGHIERRILAFSPIYMRIYPLLLHHDIALYPRWADSAQTLRGYARKFVRAQYNEIARRLPSLQAQSPLGIIMWGPGTTRMILTSWLPILSGTVSSQIDDSQIYVLQQQEIAILVYTYIHKGTYDLPHDFIPTFIILTTL